jgi:hypothetical protein
MCTALKGTIAVVVAKVKFAKISLSPVQPVKRAPFGAASATTVTIVPGEYSPLGLPFATLNRTAFGSLEPVAPSSARDAEPAFNSAIVAATIAVAIANSLLILFMLMGYYRPLRQTESMLRRSIHAAIHPVVNPQMALSVRLFSAGPLEFGLRESSTIT